MTIYNKLMNLMKNVHQEVYEDSQSRRGATSSEYRSLETLGGNTAVICKQLHYSVCRF